MHGEQHPVPMYEQGIALLDYGFALPRDASVGRLTEPPPGETLGASTASPTAAGAARTALDDGAASPASGTTSWETPLAIGAVVVLGLVVLAARMRRRG